MVSTNPADRFIQAYRNLDLFPLLAAEDIAKFRVEYGRRTLARLKQEILALPANGKVMFTGHRGGVAGVGAAGARVLSGMYVGVGAKSRPCQCHHQC